MFMFVHSMQSKLLCTMLIVLVVSFLSSKLSIFLGALILGLCLAFSWNYWKFLRAYRHFPSTRLDIKWMSMIIKGRIPKDVPYTSALLQESVKSVNTFSDEGLCVVWFFRPYIVVYGEEFMKILANEADLGDKGSAYEINKLMFRNGLLGSKHEVWKGHRKLLNPAFNLRALKSKVYILNECAQRLVKKLETVVDKPIDDVVDILKLFAFETMADYVLGLKFENERQKSIADEYMKVVDSASKKFMERVTSPWLHWDFMLPLFRSGRKYLTLSSEGERLMREVKKDLMKKCESENEEEETDFETFSSPGSILLKQHLQDPTFSEEDVIYHLANLTAAGYETVTHFMMWCFYVLGHHPEEQEKAYEEVQSIVPEGDVTYDHMSEMKYLDCVIKEALRLYTPVPVYERKAINAVQCGPYTLPKGAYVLFCPFLLHRDHKIYPHPEKFDPERFSDVSKIHPWAFVPFSEGYRNCIGKKFAMMEMKVQLAHVLRRFKIKTLNKIENSQLDWNMVLKSTTPPRFLLEYRQSES